jgi:hypothetical protein
LGNLRKSTFHHLKTFHAPEQREVILYPVKVSVRGAVSVMHLQKPDDPSDRRPLKPGGEFGDVEQNEMAINSRHTGCAVAAESALTGACRLQQANIDTTR